MSDNTPDRPAPRGPRLSRRGFLKGSGLATAGVVAAQAGLAQAAPPEAAPDVAGAEATALTLDINGRKTRVLARADEVLVDTLRDRLGMTGTKLVCGRGACSACTVLVDGEPQCSCLTLTHELDDAEITTIEGLAEDTEEGLVLTPVQEAFVEEDASMCGYCTPGMVLSCTALLNRNPDPTLHEVKAAVRGNLCRCGTYPHVFKAALCAAEKMG